MTAYPIPNPFSQWIGTDGKPLDGAFIYIGEANQDPETNPIAVYQDADLTIPLDQPIRTTGGYVAGSGTPINMFPSTTPYSIRVRARQGSSPGPQVLYLAEVRDELADALAEINATLTGAASTIQFTQNGTGAVTRTILSKMRDIVSVEDFGADPTGVADSYDAFDKAVNSGAKKVIALGSSYKTTDTVIIPAGVELIGAGPNGTTLNVTGNVVGVRVLSYSKLQGFKVQFSGGHTHNGVEAGDLTNFADRAVLQDLYVTGAGNDGIQVRNGNCGTIRDVTCASNGRDGLNFTTETNDNNAWVLDGRVDVRGNTRDGLHISAGSSQSDPLAPKSHSANFVIAQNNGRYDTYIGSRSNSMVVYNEAGTTQDIFLDMYAYGNAITILEGGTFTDNGTANLITTQNADADYFRQFVGKVYFDGDLGKGLRINRNDGTAGFLDLEKTAIREFTFKVDGSSADQVMKLRNAASGFHLNLDVDGSVSASLLYLGTNGVYIATGTGTPEGSLIAPRGSQFLRQDGGAGTCLYVKESGTGNTGWVAK